jgi:EpsI family protein
LASFTAASVTIAKQYETDQILPRKNFIFFPLEIGNWVGQRDRLSDIELQTLNLTDYFVGNYTYQGNENFVPVNFYVAYYDKQTQENSIHSPRICLPGSGWIIASHEIHTIGDLEVNMEVLQRNNERLLIYYWFREAGHDAATKFDVKKQLLINSIRHGRTDGSLIRLTAPLKENADIQEVKNQMDDFLKNVFPRLPEFIPPPSGR